MPTAKLNRTILRLSGDGVAAWLDGLITDSLSGSLTFAALLTPQGKIIADFYIWQDAETPDIILLDSPEKFGEGLLKRLKMYRLRAPITLEDISDNKNIYVSWDDKSDVAPGFPDPRRPEVKRIMTDEPIQDSESPEAWDDFRLSIGLPDSEWDFGSAEVFPATVNMDRLAGVDFKKGCFVGQEVVSRMRRMTEIKKRLCGFEIIGATDSPKITLGERVVGDIVHTRGERGMAIIRFDRLPDDNNAPLKSGAAEITLISGPASG